MTKEKERLIKLLESVPTGPDGNRGVSSIADYLIANNVIVLPCQIGDTVYMPWCFDGVKGIAHVKVTDIFLNDSDSYVKTDLPIDNLKFYTQYNGGRFGFDDFGKTVFLTRKQAEKYIRQKEKNNGY